MCFSYEVSVATLIFSWSVGIYLLNSRKMSKVRRQAVIFLLIFSLIQLSDAVLWKIGMKHNAINYYVTSYLIPALLSSQIIYWTIVDTSRGAFKNALSVIYVVYLFARFHGYSSQSLCKNGLSSPIWGSREIQWWEMVIFAYLITTSTTAFLLLVAVVFPLIWLLTGGGYGSMWCFISNALAVYYLYDS